MPSNSSKLDFMMFEMPLSGMIYSMKYNLEWIQIALINRLWRIQETKTKSHIQGIQHQVSTIYIKSAIFTLLTGHITNYKEFSAVTKKMHTKAGVYNINPIYTQADKHLL